MNAAHAHLLLNHLPVIGILFSTLLLAFAWAHGDEALRRVALSAVTIAGLLAVPAYLTGEPAEEVVEKIAAVSEESIESHEEIAKFALGASLAAAIVAVGGLWGGRRTGAVSTLALAATFAVSCVAMGLLGVTANRGAKIRHSEITDHAASEPAPP